MRALLQWTLASLLAFAAHASTEFQRELGAIVDDTVGADWTLPSGGLLHLRIIDHQFHAFFLDETRAIIEPTLDRVILRGEETLNKTNEIHLPLRRVDLSLTHPRRVFPPYDYWLMVVIPREGNESTVLLRQRFRQ